MTQEQKAAKAWEKEALKLANDCISKLTHPTPQTGAISGYVIGIKDFQQALIKRVEEEAQVRIHLPRHRKDANRFLLFSADDIIQLIKETEPIKQ